jgi:hypothetical protein
MKTRTDIKIRREKLKEEFDKAKETIEYIGYIEIADLSEVEDKIKEFRLIEARIITEMAVLDWMEEDDVYEEYEADR